MQARSHLPFACTCWWLVATAVDEPITMANTTIAALSGLLPDIDHPQSTVGRRIRFISVPIAKIFGHRGFTHSLLAIFLMLAVLAYHPSLEAYADWSMPLAVGYLSHLLGDALTPSGVPLFYPYKKNFSLNLFKTGSWWETAFTTGVMLLAVRGFDLSDVLVPETLAQSSGEWIRAGKELLESHSKDGAS